MGNPSGAASGLNRLKPKLEEGRMAKRKGSKRKSRASVRAAKGHADAIPPQKPERRKADPFYPDSPAVSVLSMAFQPFGG